MAIQYRPWWEKRSGYGTLYQLASYYYFPRRIPPGYALYHVASQMMGNSARHVTPAVVTVQDLVALRYRANHPWLSTLIRIRHLKALLRAAALIFSTEFTRRDFLARFPYPVDRTFVVPFGTSEAFRPGDRATARAALGVAPELPVLLHVGSEEPRKNVATLLRALPRVAARHPEVLLVRVGAGSSRARRLIARLGLDRHVRYVRDVSDADLATWYAAADMLVFPSVLEGFGLPLLEALQCGCPVVAANTSSIPEVTGDAASLVDDPLDQDGLAAAIVRVLEDADWRAELARRGPPRAAGFSWRLAAERTAAVYDRVLGGG